MSCLPFSGMDVCGGADNLCFPVWFLATSSPRVKDYNRDYSKRKQKSTKTDYAINFRCAAPLLSLIIILLGFLRTGTRTGAFLGLN